MFDVYVMGLQRLPGIDAVDRKGPNPGEGFRGCRVGKERAVAYGQELLRTVGPDRLMWASDWPFADHENQFSDQDTIDAVRAWVPPGPARDRIFGRNPLGLYFS